MHSDLERIIQPFRWDAAPVGILISAFYALSTLIPEANPTIQGEFIFKDELLRNKQIYNIIGVLPTLVARIYRHGEG